ncbi:MAG: hypothetical protein Q9200_004581 [Gallowayella weberi]
MIDDGSSATAFFQSGFPPNTTITFPDTAEHASQWTTDFIGFVDGLDTQGLLTQQRGPLTFAYAVFVDGTTYNTELGLSILVTVTDELTIVVPSTKSDTTRYIDIPIQNITTIHLEAAGPGSQSNAVESTESTIIVLHLSKTFGAAYYINELSRPACRINIAFDTLNDATFIKDQIETMASPQDVAFQNGQRSHKDELNRQTRRPADNPSQTAILKISSQPTNPRNTSNAVKPLGQEVRQLMGWIPTASQAHEVLAESARLHSSNEEVSEGRNRIPAKDAADLAARSEVMAATEGVNVSEEVVRDLSSAQEKNLSGNPTEARLRSSLNWRDGLNIIENAAEFQPNPKLPQSASDEELIKAKRTPEAMSDDDDFEEEDLYVATPRAPKEQPVIETPTEHQQPNGNCEKQRVTDEKGSNRNSKKLSRSMQVSEGEQPSVFPPIEKDAIIHKGKGASANPAPSTAAHARSANKHKSTERPAKVSDKKSKHPTADKGGSKLLGDVNNTVEAPIERDIFDVLRTPSGKHKALIEAQKRQGSKARVSTGSGANTTARRAKVATNPKRLSKANRPGDNIAEQEKHRTVITQTTSEALIAEAERIPAQATKTDKVVKTKKSVKVTKNIETGESNLNGPARPLRSKRAAAQKANQLIMESVGVADDGESAVDTQPSLSEEEVVEETYPHRQDEKALVDRHGTGWNVRTSKQNGPSPTEKAIDQPTPLRTRLTPPGKPNNVEAELVTSAQLKNQQSVNNPRETPIEPEKPARDVLLEGSGTTPYQQVDTLKQTRIPRVVEEKERYEDEGVLIDKTVMLPPQNSPALRDENDYQMERGSAENVLTVPNQGGEGIREEDFHHLVRDDEMVETRQRLEESMPVHPGSDGKPISRDVTEDPGNSRTVTQTDREVVPIMKAGKLTGQPRSLKGGYVQIMQEQPLDRDISIAAATISPSRDEDQKKSREFVDRQHLSGQNRTLTTSTTAISGAHFASKLSSLLAIPELTPKPNFAAPNPGNPAIHGNTPPEAIAELAETSHTAPLRRSSSNSQQKLEQSSVEAVTGVTANKEEPVLRSLGQDDLESLAKPNVNNGNATARSDPYIVIRGSSSDLPSPVDQDNAVLTIQAEALEKANMGQKKLSNSNENQVLVAPPRLPTQYQQLHETSASKKRSRNADDQIWSKKPKLRFQADMTSASNPSITESRVVKDLSDRSQLISSEPKGPRNQGRTSPERHTVTEYPSEVDRGRDLTRGLAQKRKRDHGIHVRHGVHGDSPRPSADQGQKKARIEEPNDSTAAPDHVSTRMGKEAPLAKRQPPAENRQPLLIQRPRGQAKGSLAAHSSLFDDDLAPNVSSQGSRVDENGSPLPPQRTRSFVYPAVEQMYTGEVDSDLENVVPFLKDDEAMFIDAEMDGIDEPELPAFTTLQGARIKEATFTGSSNSKHGPSSPTAPSAMLTDIQAHAVQPGGRLVNVHTDAVLVPATLHDPFTSPKARPPNSFLDRLRRKCQGVEKDERTAPIAKLTDKPSDRRTWNGIDPDATLVEVGDVPRPAKTRRRATSVSRSISSLDTSQQHSRSSQGSAAEEAARKRWRDALEPHQKDTLGVLYEVSHHLVGHLIDTETAAKDVVDDYQRRGSRLIENLANDLKKGVDQYVSKVKKRRSEEMGRYQELDARVTKNLKRKPVAEDLARQMAEKKRVLDGKMEEAMRFCNEMRL